MIKLTDFLPPPPGKGPPIPRILLNRRGWAPLHKLVMDAADDEKYSAAMYREIAQEATDLGRPEVAKVVRSIAEDEDHHRRLLDKLAEQTRGG